MLSVDGSSGGLTTDLVNADISLFLYAIAAGVTIAITLAITYRRYRRLTL
jgi:hypothetical protein